MEKGDFLSGWGWLILESCSWYAQGMLLYDSYFLSAWIEVKLTFYPVNLLLLMSPVWGFRLGYLKKIPLYLSRSVENGLILAVVPAVYQRWWFLVWSCDWGLAWLWVLLNIFGCCWKQFIWGEKPLNCLWFFGDH
jgi:hypothetical protein